MCVSAARNIVNNIGGAWGTGYAHGFSPTRTAGQPPLRPAAASAAVAVPRNLATACRRTCSLCRGNPKRRASRVRVCVCVVAPLLRPPRPCGPPHRLREVRERIARPLTLLTLFLYVRYIRVAYVPLYIICVPRCVYEELGCPGQNLPRQRDIFGYEILENPYEFENKKI